MTPMSSDQFQSETMLDSVISFNFLLLVIFIVFEIQKIHMNVVWRPAAPFLSNSFCVSVALA